MGEGRGENETNSWRATSLESSEFLAPFWEHYFPRLLFPRIFRDPVFIGYFRPTKKYTRVLGAGNCLTRTGTTLLENFRVESECRTSGLFWSQNGFENLERVEYLENFSSWNFRPVSTRSNLWRHCSYRHAFVRVYVTRLNSNPIFRFFGNLPYFRLSFSLNL